MGICGSSLYTNEETAELQERVKPSVVTHDGHLNRREAGTERLQ